MKCERNEEQFTIYTHTVDQVFIISYYFKRLISIQAALLYGLNTAVYDYRNVCDLQLTFKNKINRDGDSNVLEFL
jgi:hypothetical protein